MRFHAILAVVLLLPLATRADEAGRAELARVLHQLVTDKMPRQHEDLSGWGKTIPVPDRLLLPGLRKGVMVNGKPELPHGTWKRAFYWLDDPRKDLTLRVLDFRKPEGQPYQLKLEATLAVHAERERKEWQKGLQLIGITVNADAVVTATFDCEITVAVNLFKLPPEVKVTPKVTRTQLELQRFDLQNVGGLLQLEDARQLGNDLKGLIGELVRQNEAKVTELANQALERGLRENKGSISTANLIKAANKALPKDQPSQPMP